MGIADAVRRYQSGDYLDCSRHCELLLQQQPGDHELLFLLALCHWRNGSANVGLRLIKQAVELNSSYMHYDYLRERLKAQGERNQLYMWEALFKEYLRFREVEAFLISYPKCGRTWLRMLLGWYAGGLDAANPMEVFRLSHAAGLTRLDVSHDDYPHFKPADRQFTDKQAYGGKTVLFLVRDPRDVLVSNYFQFLKRGDRELAGAEFTGNLPDFIRSSIGGIEGLVGFYNLWARNRNVPAKFEIITYEDLLADDRAVLQRCINLLGWPDRGDNLLTAVIDSGKFGKLRKLEAKNAFNDPRLAAGNVSDPESFKIRRGKAGGYVDYLSADDIAFIDGYLDVHLDDAYAMYKR
jgi:hypothetical protein